MNVRTVFIDTNILVRANVEEAPLHQEMLTAIRTLAINKNILWISRQVLREFAATLTRPQGFATPRPASVVIKRVRYFQSRFNIAEDTATVTDNLLTLLETIPVGGKQVHDANIVATMQAHQIRHLFTLNIDDFKRFSDHITLITLEDIQG